jgi:hypothetical protein
MVLKKLMKDSMDITKTGIVLGIGSGVIHDSGGDALSLSGLSKALPTLGSLSGTSAVFTSLNKLKKK